MRRLHEVQTTTWLLLTGFVSLCLISLMLLLITLVMLRSAGESHEMRQIEMDMRVAWDLLHQLGPDVHMEDGQMFAGSVPLADNFDLVDTIQALVGGTATVFQGDMRITTNVRDRDGRRGVGTRLAAAEVRKAVLEQGRPFRGVVDILGVTYYAGYDPIVDRTGSVIGILYVGDAAAGVLDTLSSRTAWLLGMPAVAIMLIGAMFVIIGVKLSAQIKARQRSLEITGAHLNTALSNMASGLAMWGADRRLLLFNGRLSQVLNVPEQHILSGMDFHDFLRVKYGTRSVTGDSFESYYRDTVALMARREACAFVHTTHDARVISVVNRPTAVDGWVTTYEDVTERHNASARISFLAHYDALTRLANRALFDQRLEEMLEGAAATGEQVAVLGIDLDHFKPVNDTLGHAVGDRLLVAVAERLSSLVRDTDLVARLGGDEFAIVMPRTSSSGHLSLAGRIVECLQKPFSLDDQAIVIGVSIGIAQFPDHGTTGSELQRCADIAMYRAKEDGRNTFRLFEAAMDRELQDRRALERDLRKAIETEAFELHYQPLVCCRTGAVDGYEALLRWNHPTLGSVPPSVFVPLAEETNQILKLGRWVMETACRTAAGWDVPARVAVNLSPAQFRQRDLVDMVLAALDRAGLQPARLEVEITEGVLVDDAERAVAVLSELRATGVRVSLDDFGTGYSSLSYLQRFPLDKIKIDKSFIDTMACDPQSASIVKALISLAHTLKLTVTAEGVETPDQLSALRRQLCDQVQGYLLGRPKPFGAQCAAVMLTPAPV